jgi:hypothetical protein
MVGLRKTGDTDSDPYGSKNVSQALSKLHPPAFFLPL